MLIQRKRQNFYSQAVNIKSHFMIDKIVERVHVLSETMRSKGGKNMEIEMFHKNAIAWKEESTQNKINYVPQPMNCGSWNFMKRDFPQWAELIIYGWYLLLCGVSFVKLFLFFSLKTFYHVHEYILRERLVTWKYLTNLPTQ